MLQFTSLVAIDRVPHLICPRLCPLDLDLLVLNVDKVLGDGPRTGGLVAEREEPEPAALLLLLVVHDDNLDDLAVPGEEGSQVGLRYARGKPAEENLKIFIIDQNFRDLIN